ncbi:hypothetical protein FSP39_002492 [Pinctada imbricata]|uniref:Uncharacterized protein n=1 Tax=Pinctada imbricata TaxID=66713 RepID=A0AA88XWQ0_PINIB|nr:hypothetical protein FSP39_002492 [Pinctada imbricata]
MDAQALSYHNKVQDWTQMYLLAADGNVYKNSKLVTYLPPQKLQQIETWRKDVSKNLKKKSGFPRLQTPKADLIRNRAMSARIIRTEPETPKRIWSASSGKSLYRGQHLYSGTDLFSVRQHLNDTSRHYAAQRQDIHSANSQRKRSIKINNKKLLNSDKDNITKEQTINTEPVVNGLNSVGEAEDEDERSDNLDIQTDDGSGSDLSSISRMAGRGTVIQVNDETMIQVRSQSNHLLNVISIDDCKRTDYNVYQRARLKVEKKRQMYQNGDENATNDQDIQETRKAAPQSETNKTESETSRKFGRSTTQASTKSVAESRNQIKGRTAKISKAIDEMVHERKVMNNMDRNFDARIEPAGGRLILDRGEGGTAFKRLNSALKRHIDNMLLHNAHRNVHFRNASTYGDMSETNSSLREDIGRHGKGSDRVRFYEDSVEVKDDQVDSGHDELKDDQINSSHQVYKSDNQDIAEEPEETVVSDEEHIHEVL